MEREVRYGRRLGLLSEVLILKIYNEIKFVLLSMAINTKVKI